MTDNRQRRLTTGRPLDEDGEPSDGPALALDPGGEPADLLGATDRPLASNPRAGTWGVLLSADPPALLQWLAPDATEPPAHVHPDATETFEALSGTLTVDLDGEARVLSAGESVTVEAGVAHTFRNDTDRVVAFRAELPSMLTARSLYTVWGLDHEGAAGPDGEPGPLHALVMAADLRGDTHATAVPVALQRALGATLGRLARAAGCEGVDERYLDDAFWEQRVEQPEL
jgi:mannose-6-phosphate isomerase-like protein (cupin superfamily)